jgi:hypothetical protein
MSELLRLQMLFAQLISRLPGKAKELGYDVVFEECARSNEQAELNAMGQQGRERVAALIEDAFPLLAAAIRDNGKANGIRNSGHMRKLALDVSLFKNGVYLGSTEDYHALGEWWLKQDPLCRWGGLFSDGNHFSIEYQGIK